MTNAAFLLLVDQECNELKQLFKNKNRAYGDRHQIDIFNNFRATASRIMPDQFEVQPEEAMFKVAETLVDKHNIALAKGMDVPDAKERLRDRILYSMMELAIIEEFEKKTMPGMERERCR